MQVEMQRQLQMKQRLSKQDEIEIEAKKGATDPLLHMIKMLDQKGLCLEDFYRSVDLNGTGIVSAIFFKKIISKIGFPCSPKDMAGTLINYSNATKLDSVNYHAFLKDADIAIKIEGKSRKTAKDIQMSLLRDWSQRLRVLLDVKRTLIEATLRMKKQKDYLFGMFAKWDSDMIGSITSIQLLRVLVQLHVILTEKDQDLLVSLLDSTSSGRADYKYLIDFCFPKYEVGLKRVSDKSNMQDYSESMLPPRRGSNNNCNKTIQSPTALLPVLTDDGLPIVGHRQLMNESSSNSNISQVSGSISNVERSGLAFIHGKQLSSSLLSPLYCPNNMTNSDETKIEGKAHLWSRTNSEAANLQRDISAPMLDTLEQSYFAEEIDTCSEEDDYQHESFDDVQLSECGVLEGDIESRKSIEPIVTIGRLERELLNNFLDANDTNLKHKTGRIDCRSSGRGIENQSNYSDDDSWSRPIADGDDGATAGCIDQMIKISSMENDPIQLTSVGGDSDYNIPSNGSILRQPFSDHSPEEEHQQLLACQTLASVRDMILTRYKAGKPLTEIFRHFDRIGKMFFNARDFEMGTADLRIEITNRVAAIAIAQIALDDCEHVTFGEFQVFILDADHNTLECSILRQMAEQLDKQGRMFQTLLRSLFRDKEKPPSRALTQAPGFISTRTFVSSLKKLGLNLTESNISRLVRRFDITGTGVTCCAFRFVRWVERSEVWIQSEGILVDHEIVLDESAILRAQVNGANYSIDSVTYTDDISSKGMDDAMNLNEDMICMAEYLGIKVISEPHLLWIVRDAVMAQLPSPWILKKHSTGRSCYFNQDTNVTSWSHPDDQMFRILRDQHRLKREIISAKDKAVVEQSPTTTPVDPIQLLNHTSCPSGLNRSLSSDQICLHHQSCLPITSKYRAISSEKTSPGLERESKRGRQWRLPQRKEYWAVNVLNSRALKDFESHALGMPSPTSLKDSNRSSRDSNTSQHDIQRKNIEIEAIREIKDKEREWRTLPEVSNPPKSSANLILRPLLTSSTGHLSKRKGCHSRRIRAATWCLPPTDGAGVTNLISRNNNTSGAVINRTKGNDKKKNQIQKDIGEMRTQLSVVDRLMFMNKSREL